MYHKCNLTPTLSTGGLAGYSFSFIAVTPQSTQLIAKTDRKTLSLYTLYKSNTITVHCYINILSVFNSSIRHVLFFLAAWIKNRLKF